MAGLSERTLAKLIARGRTEELREEARTDRAKLVAVKDERRGRLGEISRRCKALRVAHTADAQQQRAQLRAAIGIAREVIKDKCKAARGEAEEATAQRLIDAIAELDDVRDRLRVHLAGIKLPPKDPGRVRGGVAAAELQQEAIDQVVHNLEADYPELVPVWLNMARRMPRRYRATERRSAFEGFLEWAEENAGDVAEIQDRLLGRAVKEWTDREEEEQRAAHEAAEVTRKRRERAIRKLVKVTAASVKKQHASEVIERLEQVMAALEAEHDEAHIVALRKASDVLQADLIRRGLFVDQAAAEEIPF